MSPEAQGAGRRRHILVVEDDPLVAEVVVAALEEGYQTSLAETSAAARHILGRSRIHLMLLDCTLPDGTDPALINIADGNGIPVVLMSGDPQRTERLTLTPRPFILKPFTLAELFEAIESAIRGAASTAY